MDVQKLEFEIQVLIEKKSKIEKELEEKKALLNALTTPKEILEWIEVLKNAGNNRISTGW